MKLILENWRKYLAEGEAEQFPWLKELKEAATFEDKGKVLENEGLFKLVGKGVFRKVYQPIKDEDYVVKIAKAEHTTGWHRELGTGRETEGHVMNEDDFKLSIKYSLIFPKAYAHSEDFSWVVFEKVNVVGDSEEAMQKILDKSFPAEQKAIEEIPAANQFNYDAGPWPERVLDSRVDAAGKRLPSIIMRLIMSSYRSDRRSEKPTKGNVQKMQDLISSGAGGVYDELSKAMAEYSINPREFGKGENIGYDKDYNFKIIDSSVFGKQT